MYQLFTPGLRLSVGILLFLLSGTSHIRVDKPEMPLSQPSVGKDTIPYNAQKLIAAYPNFVKGYADDHIILKDGTKLLWDDGVKNKSPQQLLDKSDLDDMFAQHYDIGEIKANPPKNFDPGRIRNEVFFLKMYGSSESEVRKNLTEIVWCPKLVNQKITVTRINGVDKKIQQLSAELDNHPELKKYLTNIGGTFAWRNIAGTHRHSMHSYGMTIDINTTYSDYWEWACKCTNENATLIYKNRIPNVIVQIFEKYGFVWGGKWYHYDTMHFEYRPELLI
ncbi:M15 family metallopeptidase [Mucilaginibacter sp. L3T2-6]|uniref:M15 family metallopeptidase n=1 Tax=Mucilaginibacter sp. L3T2-6 TaxID=3062491 RepID=UPI0026756C13|nr:M15 family metallopeptidase [Mucilaginibacter sp. L3T2-6]MDO3644452.1 M15 family metallopeptidase [Mucilaginibacter sp. L3T2-6]MDV6216904.1 M15 family metallopeptidase [Mucilaginibacter sp. L3T2-6]